MATTLYIGRKGFGLDECAFTRGGRLAFKLFWRYVQRYERLKKTARYSCSYYAALFLMNM